MAKSEKETSNHRSIPSSIFHSTKNTKVLDGVLSLNLEEGRKVPIAKLSKSLDIKKLIDDITNTIKIPSSTQDYSKIDLDQNKFGKQSNVKLTYAGTGKFTDRIKQERSDTTKNKISPHIGY